MSYTTGTIAGHYAIPGGQPFKGEVHYEIIPSVPVIADAAGDTILTGRVKDALTNGTFTATVPASDDPDLDPTGVTYTVVIKFGLDHLTVPGVFVPAGQTVQMADVTPVDPAAPQYAVQVTRAEFDALAADVAHSVSGAVVSVNTRVGAVVLSAADVGAETPTGAQTKADAAQTAATAAASSDATAKANAAQSAATSAAATDATTKANAAQAAAVQRANHTGTQSADTLTDGTTNKAFLATERTKLTGVAVGATANDTDANLKARANHTGTQPASTVTGLAAVATSGLYSDVAGAPSWQQRFRTGLAYYYFAGSGATSGTAQLANNGLRLRPWAVGQNVTIDRLFAEITTAGNAGATFVATIYADDGNGYPGALVASATIAADVVAVTQATIATTPLPIGLYHVGGVVQNAATTAPFMRIGGPTNDLGTGASVLPAAGAAFMGWFSTQAGAVPNPFPTSGQGTTGAAPRIGVRVV